MSSEGKIILANAESDSNQGSGGRKMGHLKPPEQSIRCPRCESPNTKFCYYNNYSLSQPRYFCKTCRRYWTQGGALRNVPIGGGCRKNKKIKLNSALPYDPKCSPSLEFRQLGAIQDMGAISTTSSSTANVNGINPSCFDMYTTMGSNLGLNYFSNPFMMQGESGTTFNGGIQGLVSSVSLGFNTSLASSFESLSSINQELHWKLQQQRLGLVLGGEDQKEFSGLLQNEVQKPEPTSYQNLEMSKQEAADRVVTSLKRDGDVGGNITSDEWAAQNSFNPANTMRNNKQLQCNPWME